jgi:hypothetical protein
MNYGVTRRDTHPVFPIWPLVPETVTGLARNSGPITLSGSLVRVRFPLGSHQFLPARLVCALLLSPDGEPSRQCLFCREVSSSGRWPARLCLPAVPAASARFVTHTRPDPLGSNCTAPTATLSGQPHKKATLYPVVPWPGPRHPDTDV